MVDHENEAVGTAPEAPHVPHGGRWAIFAGVSIASIPLIAILPGKWKVPVIVVSLACLALSLIMLASRAVRDHSDSGRSS
jgi:hypothetical protein